MAGGETDFYQDHEVRAGTTFSWAFEVNPLDLTDCQAVLHTYTLAGDVAGTVSTRHVGVTPYGRVDFTVPATTTAGWAPGLYSYKVVITFADGVTKLPYGNGMIEVLA